MRDDVEMNSNLSHWVKFIEQGREMLTWEDFGLKIPVLRSVIRAIQRLNAPAPLHSYPDYDDYWTQRHATGKNPGLMHRYKVVASAVPRNASVLDIGCGDGAFGKHLLTSRPDCSYFGADLSTVAIDLLLSAGLKGTTLNQSTPLNAQVDGHFNVIVMMEVLEHIHDAEEVMKSALTFKPDVVFVSIPNVGCITHRLRLALFGRFPVTTIIFHMKEHIRFWTYKDFRQWAGIFDLHITSCIGQLGGKNALANYLARRWPKLFAKQVIYVLRSQSKPT